MMIWTSVLCFLWWWMMTVTVRGCESQIPCWACIERKEGYTIYNWWSLSGHNSNRLAYQLYVLYHLSWPVEKRERRNTEWEKKGSCRRDRDHHRTRRRQQARQTKTRHHKKVQWRWPNTGIEYHYNSFTQQLAKQDRTNFIQRWFNRNLFHHCHGSLWSPSQSPPKFPLRVTTPMRRFRSGLTISS